jgi:hypothetical protein
MNIWTLKPVQRGQPAFPTSCCYLEGSNMCLHSYTFVFSLQETEEIVSFDYILQPDMTNLIMNQEDFDGFSFVNHGVKQET